MNISVSYAILETEGQPGAYIMEENQNSNEDEYSFMQEVIKDTDRKKKLRRDILRMVGLGLILGVVACVTFCALYSLLGRRLFQEEPEDVTIPKDEETEAEEQADEDAEGASEADALDADSYTQMLNSLHTVAAQVDRSVVSVTGYTGEEDWAEEADAVRQSVSGLLVADNGQEFLIFAQNVRGEDIDNIRVTFADGREYTATPKSRDANLGFSIYAVDKSEIDEKTLDAIDVAVLGNSHLIEMGDTVLVLGRPFGNAQAVSYGIVASGDNFLEGVDGRFPLVYTDVSGSEVGSGVIANVDGEIIGVIDQSVSDDEGGNQIVGYGISGIKDVIELLSNGSAIPYIGISGMDVTEQMAEEGLPQGVYVREVEVDSPAMAAGIKSGDIITRVGNSEIRSYDAYRSALMNLSIDSTIPVSAKRQGAGDEYVDLDFDVTIAEKEE